MTAKRQALGRGLESLLGGGDSAWNQPLREVQADPVSVEGTITGAIASIPIDLIDTNPNQPRKQFNDGSLEELSQSIKTDGLIQPLTVRRTGKRYQLIAGERRLRACKLAGLDEVPVYIRMATDKESLVMALKENIQRENLNAIDEALAYQGLMETLRLTQEQLAERLNKGRSTIANFLRLLTLPAQIQLYLTENKISMAHARCLAGVEDEVLKMKLAEAVVEQNLSVHQLEELIQQGAGGTSGTKKGKTRKTDLPDIPEWCLEQRNNLSEKLQTPVSVKPGKKGKGTLVIAYSSDENLQKIFDLLNGK